MKECRWELAPMQLCKLPEKVANGFTEVAAELIGDDLMPVLYCGSQVTDGINHMIICKRSLVTKEIDESLVTVILHEEVVDDVKSNFALLYINTLC